MNMHAGQDGRLSKRCDLGVGLHMPYRFTSYCCRVRARRVRALHVIHRRWFWELGCGEAWVEALFTGLIGECDKGRAGPTTGGAGKPSSGKRVEVGQQRMAPIRFGGDVVFREISHR
jgi:hypothetical protein